jgi:hypothetical protein
MTQDPYGGRTEPEPAATARMLRLDLPDENLSGERSRRGHEASECSALLSAAGANERSVQL